MRTLLVRRFESSQKAFRISLSNMLTNHRNIKNWAEKRQAVPVFKKELPDIKAMYESTSDVVPGIVDGEITSNMEKLQTRGLFEINIKYLKNDFFKDLESDIELLQTLKNKWDQVSEDNDPKLNKFIDILTDQLEKDPERRIVVFSQFADTILRKRLAIIKT